MQDVVDGRGELLCPFGLLGRYACRRNFLHLSVVLRVIVEELILRHYFRDREDHTLVLGLIAADGNLGAFEERLNHHFVALHHCHAHGSCQLIGMLHLAHAETAAVAGWLNEARHTYGLHNLLLV